MTGPEHYREAEQLIAAARSTAQAGHPGIDPPVCADDRRSCPWP